MFWRRSENRQPENAAVCEKCNRPDKNVIVVTLILAVFLTVAGCGFSATGADGDKTQEASTGTGGDKVSAVSVAVESAEGTEPEIAREEEKPEILLENIEWKDYYNNDAEWDETKLFFSFSNGESAELTVMYSPSIVEKIEYEDITGDGTEEVLVYRYFANTATEYTLIDFIEVKDGIVKNISPETDIAELADEVWNTSIEDFSVDGYACPVLRMESFRKEPCIAYLDRTYLVGYKDGSWQIIQELPADEPE